MDKMLAYLQAQDSPMAEEISKALVAAKIMRDSVSLVRVVGKTIVEVRDEAAFINAAADL